VGRILVVEDDATIRLNLVKILKKSGHEVSEVARVKEGRDLLEAGEEINLLVLDRKLPDGDGLEVCRALKADPRTRTLPVVVLTSLEEFEEELASYKSGADLFLTKPVDAKKLLKYVSTMLDRIPYRGEKTDELVCGAVTLVPKERRVKAGEHVVSGIPHRLFDILYLLGKRRGKTLSRPVIIQKLWGSTVRDKQVDISVSRLRKLLGPPFEGLIVSMRSGGYSLNMDFKPKG
jgi:DNA-binding response OmpR family regulator